MAANDFLKFKDGDVLVSITGSTSYLLHAAHLRRNSKIFEELLAEEHGADLDATARRNGVTLRYYLELTRGDLAGIGQFVRKPVDRHGIAAAGLDSLIDDFDGGRVHASRVKYWEMLFSMFYNKPVEFDDTTLATVLRDCMSLVDIAESIRAIESVRVIIDLNLLRQGNILYSSIASNPIAWAKLGYRIRSQTIFKESLIHGVGKWNSLSEAQKAELDSPDLDQPLRHIWANKYSQQDKAKEALELRILGHYPAHLTRHAGDRPGRATYASDIYMWMAICFFRQYFAQAISDSRNRLAKDGGFAFYRQLGEGGQAYLNHETFQNFHMYFPMSSKACNVLEANMGILKEEIKPFVKDLLVHRANIDPAQFHEGVHWLTCSVVEKDDFPWHVEEVPKIEDDGDEVMGGLNSIPIRGKKRKSRANNHSRGAERTLMDVDRD
ncbi:MAG: hypothetical protein Q9160_007313 [Pyrenula sp. 1 TL-2023]